MESEAATDIPDANPAVLWACREGTLGKSAPQEFPEFPVRSRQSFGFGLEVAATEQGSTSCHKRARVGICNSSQCGQRLIVLGPIPQRTTEANPTLGQLWVKLSSPPCNLFRLGQLPRFAERVTQGRPGSSVHRLKRHGFGQFGNGLVELRHLASRVLGLVSVTPIFRRLDSNFTYLQASKPVLAALDSTPSV